MTRNKINISLIIAFTALFLLFNIGMPVVLHYCEMMNTYSSSECDMCHPEKNNDGQLEYSKQQHNCCSSVVLASFNKTEFLQTQKNEEIKLYLSITPRLNAEGGQALLHSAIIYEINYTLIGFITKAPPPPLIEDIPIFTSSLLI